MSSVPQLTPAQLNFAPTAQWKTILSQALSDLRVGIPAIVVDFDVNSQTCTVQIAIREIVRTDDGPENTAINPIFKVPVAFPSAGGYSVTFPLQPGDEGWLAHADMCFDLFWSRGAGMDPNTGQNTAPQNQLERRRHDLTDCYFFPAGRSQPRALQSYSPNSLQVRSDDGTVVVDVAEAGITLTAPKVQINSSGDVDITASGKVNIVSSGNDTTIDGKVFLTHKHTGVQSGSSDTGPVL